MDNHNNTNDHNFINNDNFVQPQNFDTNQNEIPEQLSLETQNRMQNPDDISNQMLSETHSMPENPNEVSIQEVSDIQSEIENKNVIPKQMNENTRSYVSGQNSVNNQNEIPIFDVYQEAGYYYQNNGNYQNSVNYQSGGNYQNSVNYQDNGNYQNGANYQGNGNYQNSANYQNNVNYQMNGNVPLNNEQFNQMGWNQQQSAEDNKKANILCTISLVLFVCPVITAIFYGVLENAFKVNNQLEVAGSSVMEIASEISGVFYVAALVLMIIVRVKYPKNTFGKILMWIYIVLTALALIAFVVMMIACSLACGACMKELEGCGDIGFITLCNYLSAVIYN